MLSKDGSAVQMLSMTDDLHRPRHPAADSGYEVYLGEGVWWRLGNEDVRRHPSAIIRRRPDAKRIEDQVPL